jgi:hypothetical protein
MAKSVNYVRFEAERSNIAERDSIERQMEIAILLIASAVLGAGLF